MALFDTQLAMLANQASNALVSGKDPPRQGNTHPNIVPYQPFDAADQPIIIAVGNDRQFARLAEICGHPEWTQRRAVRHECRAGGEPRRDGPRWSARRSAQSPRPNGSSNWKPRASRQARSTASARRWPTFRRSIARWCARIAGVPLVGSPVRLDGERADSDLPPPRLGEHTERFLRPSALPPTKSSG